MKLDLSKLDRRAFLKGVATVAPVLALPVTGYSLCPTENVITSLPAEICNPGTYYLNEDLSYNLTTGIAITIKSADVVLDLQGHTVTGQGYGAMDQSAIGIVVLAPNCIVRNGTVRGFASGVCATQTATSASANFMAESMNAVECLTCGFAIHSATALIADCHAFDIGLSTRPSIWSCKNYGIGFYQRMSGLGSAVTGIFNYQNCSATFTSFSQPPYPETPLKMGMLVEHIYNPSQPIFGKIAGCTISGAEFGMVLGHTFDVPRVEYLANSVYGAMHPFKGGKDLGGNLAYASA